AGTFGSANGGNLTLDGAILDGMTVNGALAVNGGRQLTIKNSLTLNGTFTVGSSTNSTGTILFDGSQTVSGPGAFVFAGSSPYPHNGLASATAGTVVTLKALVHGSNGYLGYAGINGTTPNVTFDNEGTITADVAGGTITLGGTWQGSVGG